MSKQEIIEILKIEVQNLRKVIARLKAEEKSSKSKPLASRNRCKKKRVIK